MSSSDVEIHAAGLERCADLSAMLGRAFFDEPMIRWPLRPGLTEFEAGLAFRSLVDGHARIGSLLEAAEATGAAAWVPPEKGALLHQVWDDAVTGGVLDFTDDDGVRYEAMWDWVESRMPDGPIWFLDFVGVEPNMQGRGIGSALVRHGTELAQVAGVAAFLETAIPANVRLYERFGFRTIEEGDAPLGGPHIWFMLREPID